MPTEYVPEQIKLPSTSIRLNGEESDELANLNEKDLDEDDYKHYESPEQISYKLVTLSLLPDSRWKNLVNLDIIRVCSFSSFFYTRMPFLFKNSI